MPDFFDSASNPTLTPETWPTDVARDRWGRYVLPGRPFELAEKRISTQLGTLYGTAFTRATTFAKSISDTYRLGRWAERMVAHGIVVRPDLYAAVASTPLTEITKLDELTEAAKEAAGATARARLGSAVHAFTEEDDRGNPVLVPERWLPEFTAYQRLRDEAGFTYDEIERVIVVPDLGVAGTFDRIGTLKRDLTVPWGNRGGTLTLPAGWRGVVDLKTGRDLSYGWGEIAIQLKIYQLGRGMWVPGTTTYQDMPEGIASDIALVVHVPIREKPGDDATATLYAVDLKVGADAVDLCANVRAWRQRKGIERALLTVTVRDQTDVRSSAAGWMREFVSVEEQIRSAPTEADLRELWANLAANQRTGPRAIMVKKQLAKLRSN